MLQRRYSFSIIPYYSLKNKEDASKNCIIECTKITWSQSPSASNVYPTISPGEFVLCWRGASVIDIFAYSLTQDKFLMQVSLSPYRSHTTKLPDLFRIPFNNVAGIATVYDFYSRCCDPNFQVGTRKKLQANEFYVYITSSTSVVSSMSADESQIYFINASQLHEVLGDLAALFVGQQS